MSKSSPKLTIERFVADFVKKYRDEHDITQEGIANIIGVKQPYIGSIEGSSGKARYNLTHINLLADHFGLSPKDFLPDKPILNDEQL